ncbi:MAG: hypothetical protein AVDCRST_MAG27-3522 [uncultured Craurococcus sp.]|uniref:Uncharacterized protein n=1 Tax=uncultured Craurococcus sp. TaxID=1135998 RepID=A0A6J4JFA7_9PROT|nr:MAG: hypothetical protein AVDCRST_MAG27-3522 [uncultured Craurococcus sp.]
MSGHPVGMRGCGSVAVVRRFIRGCRHRGRAHCQLQPVSC